MKANIWIRLQENEEIETTIEMVTEPIRKPALNAAAISY
jgi:hypothetical protein